jgi:general secretion pathway protein G
MKETAMNTLSVSRLAKVHPAQRGFTLVELMIVLVIIGILAGIAVFNFRGQTDNAKKVATKAKMSQIMTALNTYYGQYSAYPPPASAGGGLPLLIQGGLLTQNAAKDAWGVDLQYYSPAGDRAYALISNGPDKLPQTEDDITQFPEQ